MTVQYLDPVQEPLDEVLQSAPRLDTLDGKQLGLFSNIKLNAKRLLEMIAEDLGQDYDFEIQTGEYSAHALMEREEWPDINKCDAVILALGDCGACSSSGIANAIDVEKRGIPCLLISTPPFTDAVTTMSKVCGMPDIRWAILDHPIGSLTEDELRDRATEGARQFREIMLIGAADQAFATAAE